MPEEVEDIKLDEIVSVWKRIQAKLKKIPIVTTILVLFSGGSLGISGYVYSVYQKSVEAAMVTAYKNTESAPYKLMVHDTDSIARVVAQEETETLKADDLFKNMAVISKISDAFVGYGGMTDDETVEFIADKFEFAEKYQAKDSLMDAVFDFVEDLMLGETESRYVDCGYIKYDTQTEKPKYFVACDDEQTWRKIRYGRPDDVNINSGKKVYYYKNEDGKSIVIPSLSNY